MNRKSLSVLLSVLVLATLVLAACGPTPNARNAPLPRSQGVPCLPRVPQVPGSRGSTWQNS